MKKKYETVKTAVDEEIYNIIINKMAGITDKFLEVQSVVKQ